jgi:hypothetical protein
MMSAVFKRDFNRFLNAMHVETTGSQKNCCQLQLVNTAACSGTSGETGANLACGNMQRGRKRLGQAEARMVQV